MNGEFITALLYGGRVRVTLNPRNHRYDVAIQEEPINGHPDGVTTICASVIPKFALIDWAGKTDVEHVQNGYMAAIEAGEPLEISGFLSLCEEAKNAHNTKRDAAGDSGSKVHDLIELHLKGESYDVPDDPDVRRGFKAFIDWLGCTNLQIRAAERLIFSEEFFYCGKTDLVGIQKRKLVVADFKTGSGVYDESPYQLAGYAVAIEEETGDKIEDGLIVHLDKKTGKWKEYPFVLDDDLKGAWKAAVIHYKNLKQVRNLLKDLKNGSKAA